MSTDLWGPYITTTTLTLADSPYNVTGAVTFSSGATLYIENGVEIVFLDNYDINIQGYLNVGCYEYDTSAITSIKGLANSTTYTYIHGINGKNRIGGITIDTSLNQYANGKFCNVLFKNLDYAIQESSASYADSRINPIYSIDNCEFTDINY
eukprot:336363_1